jgi:hypothetical protein
MFFDDHKKATTNIMAKRDAKGERTMEPTPMKAEVVKDEDGMMDGKHLAAQDVMAAHHSGSAEQLSQALSNFVDLHLSGPAKERD